MMFRAPFTRVPTSAKALCYWRDLADGATLAGEMLTASRV